MNCHKKKQRESTVLIGDLYMNFGYYLLPDMHLEKISINILCLLKFLANI